MGCNASKAANDATAAPEKPKASSTVGTTVSKKAALSKRSKSNESDHGLGKIRADKPERLYKLLARAQQSSEATERTHLYQLVMEHCQKEPMAAKWKNPTTLSTPLHLCCRLIDHDESSESLLQVLQTLLAIDKSALASKDAAGHIPLHYAMAPTTHFSGSKDHNDSNYNDYNRRPWKARSVFLKSILYADATTSVEYLRNNDVIFESGDATGGCSPLYRVLQTLPDDFDPTSPTAEYVSYIQYLFPYMTSIGNASDGDKPLALLYRRFTRQFDISEQFFAGDNSRPEVVDHRQKYKIAAGNTWKLIELLLEPPRTITASGSIEAENNLAWGLVHRAVQMETPPDLLRYIVETNAQDLTRVDGSGNLPLHYAAATVPSDGTSGSPENDVNKSHFPAFYTKYVIDELLYKFPEGASMPNTEGQYPLTLAIQAGKQWIGGGLKSLYDAYPQALEQIQLDQHPSLTRALSMDDDYKEMPQTAMDDESGNPMNGIIKDNPHDAIMLVQQEGVGISEVTTSMWAHEEDAGVQMLGCVAIAKQLTQKPENAQIVALTAVAAVVNAMKAHPNEMIVQEKACAALKSLASADGNREVSMVASGAIAAIVGAMQAHVGDANVQQEACGSLAALVSAGGGERATVVASVSGITAILNAIAAHATNVNVQTAGLNALIQITEFPHANLPELPKTQTEPLVTSAKEQFPNECGELADLLLSRM